MSDACSLFPPSGALWPSCRLPSQHLPPHPSPLVVRERWFELPVSDSKPPLVIYFTVMMKLFAGQQWRHRHREDLWTQVGEEEVGMDWDNNVETYTLPHGCLYRTMTELSSCCKYGLCLKVEYTYCEAFNEKSVQCLLKALLHMGIAQLEGDTYSVSRGQTNLGGVRGRETAEQDLMGLMKQTVCELYCPWRAYLNTLSFNVAFPF